MIRNLVSHHRILVFFGGPYCHIAIETHAQENRERERERESSINRRRREREKWNRRNGQTTESIPGCARALANSGQHTRRWGWKLFLSLFSSSSPFSYLVHQQPTRARQQASVRVDVYMIAGVDEIPFSCVYASPKKSQHQAILSAKDSGTRQTNRRGFSCFFFLPYSLFF